MLGYVRINKGELKVKEYEAYRGLYCSLCRAMGRHFGQLARITLSYDITFLLLSRLSFLGILPHFSSGRCPFNPTKKCNYCVNGDKELKYAAAVAMMMLYQKVRDNIRDSSFFRRLIMYIILPYAYFKNKKAAKLYPEAEELISQAMSRQAQLEEENTPVTDKASHESAAALGELMAMDMKEKRELAYRFGYAVGKWVYLCDAAQDIKKDIKQKSYNPFVTCFGLRDETDITEEILERIAGELNMSCAMACEAYSEAENKTLVPIVENIIYEGTQEVMNKILKGKRRNERSL